MTSARAAARRQLLRAFPPAVRWAPLAAVVATGLLVLLLGPVAWWATPAKHLSGKEKADARNATRQVLLAAVGGLVLLTGAGFSARTFYLTRRGQFTDRYGKAITHLASDKLTERLGGIYALEHLMAESARERPTVVEVLAAFVREQTRAVHPPADTDLAAGLRPRPDTDVQAALTVLGRRPEPDRYRIDLTAARLYGARLAGAQLAGAVLTDARLDGADLTSADLRQALLARASLRHAGLADARLDQALLNQADLHACTLWMADLRHVSLYNGRLTSANLTEAQLNGAVLAGSDLTGATLDRADLTGADLTSTDTSPTDLRQTTGLTSEQLHDAQLDEHTQLPPDLHRLRPAPQSPGGRAGVPRPEHPVSRGWHPSLIVAKRPDLPRRHGAFPHRPPTYLVRRIEQDEDR